MDLEKILEKEGTKTSERLLKQYRENFIEKEDLTDLMGKAEKTRKYLRENGLHTLIPVFNKSFSSKFEESDFKGAELLETPERIEEIEKEFGIACSSVSIKFNKYKWGNSLFAILKSFFGGYETVLKKLDEPQDVFGQGANGLYFAGIKFKKDDNLFLDATGISMVSESKKFYDLWAHEALHSAYRNHSKVHWYNLGEKAGKALSKEERIKIAETSADMYLVDELSARRADTDLSVFLRGDGIFNPGSYYVASSIGKYNGYARKNGLPEIKGKNKVMEIVDLKVSKLKSVVYAVKAIEPKVTQAQLTRIFFTCAPTIEELNLKKCHSPFGDLLEWEKILERYS